tara:strand:- start:173 stop:472 length:300 start_codon:yes stop_codon:yes gene_type:complete
MRKTGTIMERNRGMRRREGLSSAPESQGSIRKLKKRPQCIMMIATPEPPSTIEGARRGAINNRGKTTDTRAPDARPIAGKRPHPVPASESMAGMITSKT